MQQSQNIFSAVWNRELILTLLAGVAGFPGAVFGATRYTNDGVLPPSRIHQARSAMTQRNMAVRISSEIGLIHQEVFAIIRKTREHIVDALAKIENAEFRHLWRVRSEAENRSQSQFNHRIP